MVTVAIAGGTGNIGKTIASVLKQNPKHNVIVLARKPPAVEDPAVPVHVVDYEDVDGLIKVLDENDVQVVISTIAVVDATSGSSEIALVRAADKAGPTKRFVATNWGIPYPQKSEQLPPHTARIATATELRGTGLEFTTFHIGYISDYFGIPHIESSMDPVVINVDMEHKAACIPGTGDDIVSLTYSVDAAKFVEAALTLPKWDEEFFCYSDKCTLNQVLELAEKARGSKFTVTYDDVETLNQGKVTELPSHSLSYKYFPKPVQQAIFSKFGLYMIQGLFDLPEDKALNKVFPDIKLTSVEEIIGAWKGH